MPAPEYGRTDYEVTRMIFTPSGDATVAHAWVASVNRKLAIRSGGIFGYRFEDLLAMVSVEGMAETTREGGPTWARHYADQNLADMIALGLTPSPGHVKRQSGSDVASWYWKLFELDKQWGAWPPENIADAIAPMSCRGATLATNVMHPYIVLERVVGDLIMGCTTVLRGEDLRGETSDYIKFARMILGYRLEQVPWLVYIPILKQSSSNKRGAAAYAEAGGISTSAPDTASNRLTVRAVLDAGIDGPQLTQYLEKVYFEDMSADLPKSEGNLLAEDGRSVLPERYDNGPLMVSRVALPMDSHPIIHLEDWERFLSTGEVWA